MTRPAHEWRPVVHDTSHGYSVQSAVSQSSGPPNEIPGYGPSRKPMNVMDSEGDGDYSIEAYESQSVPQGYDLNGIGGNMLPTSPYGVCAPGGPSSRDTVPLNTHEGTQIKGSDYNHPNERGFHWRGKMKDSRLPGGYK